MINKLKKYFYKKALSSVKIQVSALGRLCCSMSLWEYLNIKQSIGVEPIDFSFYSIKASDLKIKISFNK